MFCHCSTQPTAARLKQTAFLLHRSRYPLLASMQDFDLIQLMPASVKNSVRVAKKPHQLIIVYDLCFVDFLL